MSATFKKAQKAARRSHKERHQPAARQRLGLLEKHKDYVLRARDYHSKQQRLKKLQEKAAQRNPDEFYHTMITTRTKDGVHIAERNEKFGGELVRLMNTQSLGYVNRKRQQEAKKVDKLQSSLHMLEEGAGQSTHTLFLDSKDEVRNFDPAEYFDTDPSLVDRAFSRIKRDTLQKEHLRGASYKVAGKALAASYNELAARLERSEKLTTAMEELQTQRNLMEKGVRKKVGKDERGNAVFRWKKERKR